MARSAQSDESSVSSSSEQFEQEIDYFDDNDEETCAPVIKEHSSLDKTQVATLVAKYGNSSATAWLEVRPHSINHLRLTDIIPF